MNYLTRMIGIWYHDRKWAENVFDAIIKGIPEKAILRIRKFMPEMTVVFTDESILRMVCANTTARGCRFNEVYIQDGIRKEIYEQIISPCVLPNCSMERVIRNEEDIVRGGTLAKEYYYHNTLNEIVQSKMD